MRRKTPREITEYRLGWDYEWVPFEKAVADGLRRGFQPYGPLVLGPAEPIEDGVRFRYIQAMVKYAEEE